MKQTVLTKLQSSKEIKSPGYHPNNKCEMYAHVLKSPWS